MKKFIDFIFNEILWCMPHELAHKMLYRYRMGEKLNLKDPTNINEKIQWLILNEYGEDEGNLTDKVLVKKILAEKGFEKYIIKTINVYNDVNEINIENLPSRFVLKTNNGCGNIIVCRNKELLDMRKTKNILNKALNENFAKKNLEYHYSFIKPKILCEELLDDKSGKNPLDYKFYCFNGYVHCVLVCTDRIDENNKNICYYDTKWKKLDYVKEEYKNDQEISKPENFEEMLTLASKLSVGHKFVRVDLYNIRGKIYFGELTFTPACGMIYNLNSKALDELGAYIKLDKIDGEKNG